MALRPTSSADPADEDHPPIFMLTRLCPMFPYNQLIEKDNKNHYVGKMCVLFLSFGGYYQGGVFQLFSL